MLRNIISLRAHADHPVIAGQPPEEDGRRQQVQRQDAQQPQQAVAGQGRQHVVVGFAKPLDDFFRHDVLLLQCQQFIAELAGADAHDRAFLEHQERCVPQLKPDAEGRIAVGRRGETLDVMRDLLHAAAERPDGGGTGSQRHTDGQRAISLVPALPITQAQEENQPQDRQQHPAAACLGYPGSSHRQRNRQQLHRRLDTRPTRAGAPAQGQQRHASEQQGQIRESHSVVAPADIDHRPAPLGFHGHDQQCSTGQRPGKNAPFHRFQPPRRRAQQEPQYRDRQRKPQQLLQFGITPHPPNQECGEHTGQGQ
ncbi:hypothetical protein G6F65_016266 [Rhizopus arrhizus]|nr:hypothetical protein G6F65_016266 [Rhizopus arrhizus]